MKVFATALALLLWFAFAPDERRDHALEHGRAATTRFHDGKLAELWDEFDEELQKLLGSLENLQAFAKQATGQLGAETSLVGEEVHPVGAGWSYVRTARFEKVDRDIETIFGFDSEDKIETFLIRPVPREARSEFLEYQTEVELQLPFDGEWTVFWGGRTLKENYHAAHPDQRFALDLLVLRDGSSHTGEGKENSDYHCFGQPIHAPGAGTVVVAVNDVPDNVPGEMNPKQAPGNHVILEHETGEYSLLAHFQQGSLKVAPGDKVERGARLGLCGNSGNSSEPHLHYHLQDKPAFGQGNGLPAQFVDYIADDKPVKRGEPVKGQRIRRK